MTDPRDAIPDPAERAQLNAALHADGIQTGFWADHGRPAPWPDAPGCCSSTSRSAPSTR